MKLLKVYFRECSVKHARNTFLYCSILITILFFFEVQVYVLVGEHLDSPDNWLIFPVISRRNRHYKTCIDGIIGIWKLVYLFNTLDFFESV